MIFLSPILQMKKLRYGLSPANSKCLLPRLAPKKIQLAQPQCISVAYFVPQRYIFCLQEHWIKNKCNSDIKNSCQ